MLKLFFVVVVALGWSTATHAVSYECRTAGGNGVWTEYMSSCQASAQSALGDYATTTNAQAHCNLVYPQDSPCEVRGTSAFGDPIVYGRLVQWREGPGSPEACVGNMAAGKTFGKNWTYAYTRTGDENDLKAVGPVNKPVAGAFVCMGGCKAKIAEYDAPGWKSWVSQSPTDNGLYRNSVDVPMTSTGETCTDQPGAQSPTDPAAPAPLCPGYVGEVNGKMGCYGTASNPIAPTTAPRVNTSAPDAGNPPAGDVPTAGGSGPQRTPATGNGGPAGGPAGAAIGGKGGSAGGTPNRTGATGTVGAPAAGEEQAACGAPGQPVCAVKVDEAGTPQTGDFSEGTAKLGENQTTVETAFGAAHGMQAPSWSFSFQFPTGCTGFQPPGFSRWAVSINPCEWQGTIHDLMSLVWAAVTVFCIIGMVGRTIRES